MDLYKVLLKNKIIKNGHFILRSGKHSNTYIEKTRITLFPYLYNEIIRSLVDNITKIYKYTDYDIITGPAVAGISFAAPVACELNKSFIFPEKKTLEIEIVEKIKNNLHLKYTAIDPSHKMEFRPEFKEFIKNKNIIIIEDIITTGGSVSRLCESIYNLSGVPISVFCIINRNINLNKIYYSYGVTEFAKNNFNSIVENCSIPINSLITKNIKSFNENECPICNKNMTNS